MFIIYEYKSNQFKQNLLNKISEIIRMKQEGITKFLNHILHIMEGKYL